MSVIGGYASRAASIRVLFFPILFRHQNQNPNICNYNIDIVIYYGIKSFNLFSPCIRPTTDVTMVLVLDANSEIGAHVREDLGYLNLFRLREQLKISFF